MSNHATNDARKQHTDAVLDLARAAGLLVTLDGQIGREKYQSITGSLNSFLRFVDALRTNMSNKETA